MRDSFDPRVMSKKARSPLGVIFLTIFVSMIGFGIVIPVLPIYAKNEPFKLSPSQLGWLVGVFSLVQLFSSPIIGKFSDRIGRKPVLLISIFGTAIGYFITGAASAAWMLFLGRIIDGASGGNIATAQACIADTTAPHERSKAMGMIGAAFGLGFILGPAIGGILAHVWTPLPFYFAGALSIVNAIFVITRLPETLTEEKRLHPTAAAPIGEVFAEGRAQFIGLLLVATLLGTTGFAFIHLLFALFCLDHLGYDMRTTSYAFAYVGFLAVLVQGGLLRRLLKYDNAEKPIAITGASLLALSLWLLPRVPHGGTGQFLGVCAIMALGNGMLVPTLTGMASRHVHGRAQGRVLGLTAAAGSLGRFLGPLLGSLALPSDFSELSRPLADGVRAAVEHGYVTAFSASATLLVATAIFLAAMKPLEIESPAAEPQAAG
jgi:multidrug resistance protein